jgi:hypothetical protein
MKRTSNFSLAIGKGKYDTEYEPLSEQDALGNSLLNMRDDLSKASKEEERRKMEKRIKDQINSVTELTEEEEITYIEILKTLKEQTKGKEEEVANLFENLLETN